MVAVASPLGIPPPGRIHSKSALLAKYMYIIKTLYMYNSFIIPYYMLHVFVIIIP